MKTCPSCGAILDDNIKFCGTCGTPVQDVPSVDDFDKTVAAEGIYNQNSFEIDSTATDAPAYTAPVVSETATYIPQGDAVKTKKPKKPRKPMKKGARIAILVSVCVVAIALLVGFLTNWFGLTAPVPKIIRAAAKTINADSFTLKVTTKYTYKSDGEIKDDTYKTEYKIVVDEDDENITAVMENEYEKSLTYKGKIYEYDKEGDWADIYNADYDSFFEFRDKLGNGKKIDYEGVIKDLDLSDYVDSDEVEAFVKDAMREFFNNRKWMKNTMGYKKQGKEMTFSPDLEKMCEDFAEFIDDSDVIKDDDDRDAVVEELEEAAETADEEAPDVDISVTLKRGYLETIEIKVRYDEERTQTFKFEFSDINKTEISDNEIKRIKNKTEELIEENKCVECGGFASGGFYEDDGTKTPFEIAGERYCYDCYDVAVGCDNCDTWDNSYYYDGKQLCYDCYQDAKNGYSDDYGYCDWCDTYDELYFYEGYYDDYMLCYDCRYN